MASKKEFITELAVCLESREETVWGAQLAKWLNASGYTTSYGTPYCETGGRGIFRLIEATYDYLDEQKREKEAQAVARAFTDKEGKYAYKT